MTNITRHLAICALLSATSFAASAQDLSTEVEIRYQETPELRETNKLSLTPSVTLPKERAAGLAFSSRALRVAVPGTINTLEPAAYADSIYTSPYRGYAAVGFMPKFNLGVSAGYKILDTDHTRLNAWLQYDGTAYKGEPMHALTGFDADNKPVFSTAFPDKIYTRRNTATLGLNLHQAAGRESFIDAGIDYTFDRFNMPVYRSLVNQNANRVNVSVLWSLTHGDYNYGLGGRFHHFGFSNRMGYQTFNLEGSGPGAQTSFSDITPVRENRFEINGYFAGKILGARSAGIGVDFSYINNPNNHTPYPNTPFAVRERSFHQALITLTPNYRFGIDNLDFDLGVRIDLGLNAGKVFHIAPQASVTWHPGEIVKVYGKATGGQWQNTAASLFDVTPYALPFTSWRNSNVPVEAEAGVNIGLWRGFYAEIAASFAIADDWLMPLMAGDMATVFEPVDLKGYKLHAAAGYNYRNIADLKVSYEKAPSKHKRGWYLWRDRASSVISADLKVTPVSFIDINVGWQYRGGRKMFGPQLPVADHTGDYISLRSVNNLSAGALYRITSQWSAFVKGENLLNRHSYLFGGMPAQGITGLAGVTYKF